MWRKVQVERPRASTSGGQSEAGGDGVCVVDWDWESVGAGGEGEAGCCRAMASQAAVEVQERQLDDFVSN